MNFTKTKLAVALASTLAVGSVQAFDLSAGGAPNFASEIVVNMTTGTFLDTAPTGVIDVTTNVGFSIGEGTSKYVRYDFTNAEVGTALTLADFLVGSAATTSVAIAQGGLVGSTFVIVEVSSILGDVQQGDLITFLTNGKILTKSQATASIDVDTYEDATQAIAQTNSLYNENGTWFGFATGLAASCTPHTGTKKIDVVTPTFFIDGSPVSPLTTLSAGAVMGVFNASGIPVADGDYFNFAGPASFTLTGDFAAFTGPTPSMSPSGPMTVPGTEDSATRTGLFLSGVPDVVTLFADTTTAMAPSDYTGMLNTNNTGGTYDLGTLDLGTCGTLIYSGSTDRLDFGLTPSGAFRQWVRITNPSSAGGNVTVTVYNDAGDEATFNLGDIAGVSSSTLSDHASTGLINIDDVYAAATVADATFAHNGGKLRVEVRGEFGDDALDGAFMVGGKTLAQRLANGIYIQAVTLATDNTMFDQTK